MKQKWSKADKQRYADKDRLRASSIPGKRKPAPEAQEWALEAPRRPRRQFLSRDCQFCLEYGGGLMCPPHEASENCKSGKHSHCTCDTCF